MIKIYKKLAKGLLEAAKRAHIEAFIESDFEAREATREIFRRKCQGESADKLFAFVAQRWDEFCEKRRQSQG